MWGLACSNRPHTAPNSSDVELEPQDQVPFFDMALQLPSLIGTQPAVECIGEAARTMSQSCSELSATSPLVQQMRCLDCTNCSSVISFSKPERTAGGGSSLRA